MFPSKSVFVSSSSSEQRAKHQSSPATHFDGLSARHGLTWRPFTGSKARKARVRSPIDLPPNEAPNANEQEEPNDAKGDGNISRDVRSGGASRRGRTRCTQKPIISYLPLLFPSPTSPGTLPRVRDSPEIVPDPDTVSAERLCDAVESDPEVAFRDEPSLTTMAAVVTPAWPSSGVQRPLSYAYGSRREREG